MISVGIKTKDNIYIGASSDSYTLINATYVPENMPLFVPNKAKHTICFFGGIMKELNILKFNDFINERRMKDHTLSSFYLINELYIPFVKKLREIKAIPDDEDFERISGEFLIAKDDKLIYLDAVGNSYEIEDSKAADVGCMKGDFYLKTLKNEDPMYQILKSLSLSIADSKGDYPILIKNTRNPKKTLIFNQIETLEFIKKYEAKRERN